jgi:hypothetical protein
MQIVRSYFVSFSIGTLAGGVVQWSSSPPLNHKIVGSKPAGVEGKYILHCFLKTIFGPMPLFIFFNT